MYPQTRLYLLRSLAYFHDCKGEIAHHHDLAYYCCPCLRDATPDLQEGNLPAAEDYSCYMPLNPKLLKLETLHP